MQKLFKVHLVEEYMEKNKLSKTAFAKMCKISYRALSNFLVNKPNFMLSVLFKIAKTLNLQAYQLCY